MRLKQFTRCFCCKELGHSIEECPRDPNLKTIEINLIDKDQKRLQSIKSQKKIHADTKVMSTHFLKECAKIPKISTEYNAYN